MSYLVLARKFRPQTFQSIAGQEHITRALANAILRGRVPHALLLTGPRGVGKTTTARVFARALNCTGRTPVAPAGETAAAATDWLAVEPCGECTNCIEIARSSSMAVWEIDGASNNGVDNVRELIDSLRSLPPPNSAYKIYIIDEVHMLSVAAFNALLKSLEEPPPNTVFIFATTEPHKIPETVISRCQRHDFRRLPQDVIQEQLLSIAEKEGVAVDPTVLSFVARRAQGGMRDAQSMFDRLIASSPERLTLANAQAVFGVVDEGFFFAQSEAVLAGNPQECFVQLDQAFAQSLDVRAFIAEFLNHWRILMLLGVAMEQAKAGNGGRVQEDVLQRLLGLTPSEYERYIEQARASSGFDLLRLFDIAEKTTEQALRTSFPRFVLEAGVAKMATLSSLLPLPSVIAKLEGLASSAGSGQFAAPIQGQNAAQAQHNGTPAKEVPQQVPHSLQTAVPASNGVVSKHVNGAEAAPSVLQTFNPSWRSFLIHVKTKSVRLEAFLSRVSPKTFAGGVLIVEGTIFHLDGMRETATMELLRDCLRGYSGIDKWDVQFVEHQEQNGSTPVPGATKQTAAATRRPAQHVPGSLAAMEEEARKEKRLQIEQEVRQNPSVQQLLTVFEGSVIDDIEPLVS